MLSAFAGGLTLAVFAAIVLVAFAVPTIRGWGKVGRQERGWPFTFYRQSSAAPPASRSRLSWLRLVLDLLVYYAAAIVIARLIELAAGLK